MVIKKPGDARFLMMLRSAACGDDLTLFHDGSDFRLAVLAARLVFAIWRTFGKTFLAGYFAFACRGTIGGNNDFLAFQRTARACIAAFPVGATHVFDANFGTGLRGVQHFAAAEVKADVVDGAVAAEENEIARLRV